MGRKLCPKCRFRRVTNREISATVAVPMRIRAGLPFPLGATLSEGGVNFAVYAGNAHALDLCLFDLDEPLREVARVRFPKRTRGVFHVHVEGIGAGTPYALRVHGPWNPEEGHLYNSAKLLLDPYARDLTGVVEGNPVFSGEAEGGGPDPRDSAARLPRCRVLDNTFDWGGDRPPRTPWDRTVIYETHVRGMTMTHPDVEQELRGTFAGMASPPVVSHLKRLGVTAVQMLPVQQHIDDLFLLEKGLTNYWGYQSVGFFTPQWDYAADRSPGGPAREFKAMVKALHGAGLEVILDVVYNHTGSGGVGGPHICFRGLDNRAYYRLAPENLRNYVDFTGTGNTTDMRHPRVLQLVLDSLRYWVTEMHVDGFRFDLAATLGRESDDFDPNGAFFRALAQDPVLSGVKLIAEPWDVGWGGYQLGGFPEPWGELNGRFRDDIRRFWRGDPGTLPDLASRLTGSADLFGGRRPQASVNFLTCHDGLPLYDLVSYEGKYNEANGEDNRDGEADNHSWNCGAEGETDDPGILALRARQRRNFLATTLLSQGVPFVLGGDEILRTQGGNNNAYCQDNEVSWFDWTSDPDKERQTEFFASLIRLRQAEPVFRKRRFLHGNFLRGDQSRDVVWLTPEGRAMSDHDWGQEGRRALGVLLVGSARSSMDDWRLRRHGSTFLMLLNAEPLDRPFLLPGNPKVGWQPVFDTCLERPFEAGGHPDHPGHTPVVVRGHSFVLLRLASGSEHEAQILPS